MTSQPHETAATSSGDLDAFQAGYLAGMETGRSIGYEHGYRDADVTLQQTVSGWLQANPPASVIRAMDARAAREAAAAKPLDPRTPAQVQRDAHVSWDLNVPADLADAADQDDDYAAGRANDLVDDEGWGVMNRHLIGSLTVAAVVVAVLTPALRVASPVLAAVTVAVIVAMGVVHGVVISRARRTDLGSTTEATADIAADIAARGADEFLSRCRLVAGPVLDPGHPGGMPIALWQPPAGYDRVRVLEAFNGTPGPDGRYERIAHVVDGRHRDPLTAAAASYGVPVDVYAALTART